MTALRAAPLSERRFVPNRWDLAAAPLVLGIFVLLAHGAHEMVAPLGPTAAPAISLDPAVLPEYALRTTLRMFAALGCSLVFTFTVATLAAKSRRAELIIVPLLDILQSVPVLGFISVTITWFLQLFPGRVLGAECAAIFAVFTSQAWNMALGFYQSLRTEPADLDEACRMLRLSAWQRFCRLDVPFALPGLVWNMMMSMSGGWFFVVAAESISVGERHIALPGIGSYVARAIALRRLDAIGWAIAAMLIVILVYDQLLFRPLVHWSERFRFEQTAGREGAEPWLTHLLRRARILPVLLAPLVRFGDWLPSLRLARRHGDPVPARAPARLVDALWGATLAALAGVALVGTVRYLARELGMADVFIALGLGFATLLRVVVLIALASAVWVPIGVAVGQRPRLAAAVQPLAQFLAAFPANLLFPPAVFLIVNFRLDPDVWLSPLMILGTQWYVLFNVIAGASAFPTDLREAAATFRLRGWTRWRAAILPGIFPYFVTGALTATGGCWNASIVGEAVAWGDSRLEAHGLGAYIANATAAGDYPRIVLGIAVMSAFVVLFNRLVWRRLYAFAETRFRIG